MRCYDAGRRYFSRSFVLFARPRTAPALPWRLGLAVTRKTGSAVWRNRVRRLVREFFRQEQLNIPAGMDFVVVPKRGLNPRVLTLEMVRAELEPLLRAASRNAAASEAFSDVKNGESSGKTDSRRPEKNR